MRNARLYTQLETERTLLSMIVEHSGNGVMILDADRRVLVVNQMLATMVDKSSTELIASMSRSVAS